MQEVETNILIFELQCVFKMTKYVLICSYIEIFSYIIKA